MKHKLFTFAILLFTYNFCWGQYVAHATLNNDLKNHTLTDNISGTKFILDSMQVTVTAIDKNGKQLWQTDPWKDNKLPEYRMARPIIVLFQLSDADHKEGIWISYNNTQFGYIDKQTGKFTWLGQD